MKSKFLLFSSVLMLSLMAGCAGSSKDDNLEVPTNLPPICREIDFVEQPDMREMCGVRTVRSKAYKNIPQQRYLIKPQETSIVKTGDKLELRFQNSLPITLEGAIKNEIIFNQEKRLQKITNTFDYHEIYNKGSDRIRIFKMNIPTDMGTSYDYCFRIPEKKGNDRTRSKAMGNHIETMSCADFEHLVKEKKR